MIDDFAADFNSLRRLIAQLSLCTSLLVALSAPSTAALAQPAVAAHKDKAWTGFFQRRTGWTAGDGATSIALSDGRVLWLFGDSHVNDFDEATGTLPALFQVRNAAIIHRAKDGPQADVQLVNSPPNRDLFKHPEGGKHWFWPQSGFETQGVVHVCLTALKPRGKPGPWDFQSVGRYWAAMPLADLNAITYTPLPDMKGINFGCGFVPAADGYMLAFGQKLNGLQTAVYLARFKTSAPQRDWTIWDGQRWTDDVAAAAPVANLPSVSVSACRLDDKFVLTSSALSVRCDMGTEIYVSTSDRPTGPFSPNKTIYAIDDAVQGHSPFFYIPALHPEFINSQQEVLLTYSINGYEPCIPMSVNGRMNPDDYRPRAVWAPLELIAPASAHDAQPLSASR